MAIQTQQLSESLPQFASHFLAADAKGSCAWQIVNWSATDPSDITPDQVTRPESLAVGAQTVRNFFTNRTQALRDSKAHVKRLHPYARETGHWGVWTWIEDGIVQYQSVAPILKLTQTVAGRQRPVENGKESFAPVAQYAKTSTPAVVREPSVEAYGTMVRISAETNRRLREICAEDKTTLQSVLDAAVKEYHRAWFFRRADAAYEALQQDERAWEQELAERKTWDTTLMDGLDCDERWHEDGTVEVIATKAGNRG